jgi:hypothetical protein
MWALGGTSARLAARSVPHLARFGKRSGLGPEPDYARFDPAARRALGNVLVEDGRVTGCIDVGRLGAADPYQDLTIPWENLGGFGAGAQHTLFEAYGIAAPDERRTEFHLCLDELF